MLCGLDLSFLAIIPCVPLRHIPQQRLRKDILAGTMCFFDNMYDLVPCFPPTCSFKSQKTFEQFFYYPLLDFNTQ